MRTVAKILLGLVLLVTLPIWGPLLLLGILCYLLGDAAIEPGCSGMPRIRVACPPPMPTRITPPPPPSKAGVR
jgi:hypothetical protein